MSKSKIKPVDPRSRDFVTDEGKIDIDLLKSVFDGLIVDAEKCNKGNALAGRRFRVHTVELGKNSFLAMRKVSPV